MFSLDFVVCQPAVRLLVVCFAWFRFLGSILLGVGRVFGFIHVDCWRIVS